MATTFYTSSVSTAVPQDWNPSDNSVECVGSGGAASYHYAPGTPSYGAFSGAGGAYAGSSNIRLQLGAPLDIVVGTGDSIFGGTSLASCIVGAQAGESGVPAVPYFDPPAAGGQASASVGDTRYSGGDGQISWTSADGHNCGGGGAAGPHGDGSQGSVNGVYGGYANGGTGDNGNTAADANGTQWDASHGCGGGGHGSAGGSGNGGNYGGGAGVGCQWAGVSVGNRGQGLVVMRYTPIQPQIMA